MGFTLSAFLNWPSRIISVVEVILDDFTWVLNIIIFSRNKQFLSPSSTSSTGRHNTHTAISRILRTRNWKGGEGRERKSKLAFPSGWQPPPCCTERHATTGETKPWKNIPETPSTTAAVNAPGCSFLGSCRHHLISGSLTAMEGRRGGGEWVRRIFFHARLPSEKIFNLVT